MTIENDGQYRVTLRAYERFSKALADFDRDEQNRAALPPKLWRAQRDAMVSQMEDLAAEMREWEKRRGQ
jgi:hypothetical protein